MELENALHGRRVAQTYVIYAQQEQDTVYVGSTTTTSYRRYAAHRALLRGGHHHCGPLQKAWNRLGEAAFKMVILKTFAADDDLLAAEFQVMQDLKSQGCALYNPQALQCEVCSTPLRAHGRLHYCSDICRLKAQRRRRPARRSGGEQGAGTGGE